MRSFLILFLALFATIALCVAPKQAVLITYPEDTPDSVMEQAKEAFREAVRIIRAKCFLVTD